jgi:hypothetical protein
MISLQPAPATACDPSQPLVDGDDLFTTGTLVTGLIPNTLYQCFVLVEFDGQTRCTPEDFITEVATLPNHPTDVTVSSPAFESLDVAAVAPTDATGGGAVPVAGYAFQCSLESECDPDGAWFPSSASFATDPATPVVVSGLAEDTAYNCWAATVSGDSAPYEYSCSAPAQDFATAEAQLAVVGSPGATSFFLHALGLDDPDPVDVPNFQGWALQCAAGSPACDPTGTWYVLQWSHDERFG